MRVVNDQNENQPKKEPVSLLSLPFYALLCGLGFSSILMSSFAVILVHRRLPDYWPKVVSIAGALIALLVLEVPLPVVLLSFVLAVFVADSIQRQVPVWTLMIRTLLLTTVLGLIGLGVMTQTVEAAKVLSGWSQFVDRVVQQAQQSGLLFPEWNPVMLRNLLFYQGPFYFLSGCLLSVWFSVGLAAHLKWQSEQDVYSSQSLRGLRLPWLMSVFVLILWAVNAFNQTPSQYWLAGLLHLLFVIFSIQGTTVLSVFMAQRGWKSGPRALVYVGFLFVGFYALVGLGLMSPFVFIKKNSLMGCQAKPLEEAV
ncbi:MAG: DUF2232 domain-containing protein [Proteobacteria bacterium]|nr:DUF2232 domain-containing protein [Pseudomonadota bacterium]